MTSLRRLVQPRFGDWRLSRIDEEDQVEQGSTTTDRLSTTDSISDAEEQYECPPSPLPPPPPIEELDGVFLLDCDPPPPPPPPVSDDPEQLFGGGLCPELALKSSPDASEHIYSNVGEQAQQQNEMFEARELQEMRDAAAALKFMKEKYDSLGKIKVEKPMSAMKAAEERLVDVGGRLVELPRHVDERNLCSMHQSPGKSLMAAGGTVTLRTTARDAFLAGGETASIIQQQPVHVEHHAASQQTTHQQVVQAHCCCGRQHQHAVMQQQAQRCVHQHHHHQQHNHSHQHLQQTQRPQVDQIPAAKVAVTSSPTSSVSSSSSSSSSRSSCLCAHHQQQQQQQQAHQSAVSSELDVLRSPLTDHELVQIDLFYRSHKTGLHVCPCLATLSFSTGAAPASQSATVTPSHVASSSGSDSCTTWTLAKLGIPVIVEDTGDGRRRRRVYVVLAERGTGFELWRAPVDRLADYITSKPLTHAESDANSTCAVATDKLPVSSSVTSSSSPSSSSHVLRLSTDPPISARLKFDDATAAEEFHRQLTARLPPDDDDIYTASGRRKAAKKLKEEQKRRDKELVRRLKQAKRSPVSKADISQPCCFSHVTRLERDSGGPGVPAGRRVVQLQGVRGSCSQPGSPASSTTASPSVASCRLP